MFEGLKSEKEIWAQFLFVLEIVMRAWWSEWLGSSVLEPFLRKLLDVFYSLAEHYAIEHM